MNRKQPAGYPITALLFMGAILVMGAWLVASGLFVLWRWFA